MHIAGRKFRDLADKPTATASLVLITLMEVGLAATFPHNYAVQCRPVVAVTTLFLALACVFERKLFRN
jgi:hypothetical protein